MSKVGCEGTCRRFLCMLSLVKVDTSFRNSESTDQGHLIKAKRDT